MDTEFDRGAEQGYDDGCRDCERAKADTETQAIDKAYNEGEQCGYDRGLDEGKAQGYDEGYAEARAIAEDLIEEALWEVKRI